MIENPVTEALERGALVRLIDAARQGKEDAVARLCDVLYRDLHSLARSRLRRHQPLTLLDTTALVHESFLRLSRLEQLDVTDRNHFLAYAAKVMRSVIIDFVRQKQSERRGGDHSHVPLDSEIADSVAKCEDEVIRISEVLDELAAVDPRAVQVVEMRYFAGMAEQEIADVLGVTARTVRRDWEKARLLLHAALR
jgi:RNA polymerase sigma factor (TIGR02999 family)